MCYINMSLGLEWMSVLRSVHKIWFCLTQLLTNCRFPYWWHITQAIALCNAHVLWSLICWLYNLAEFARIREAVIFTAAHCHSGFTALREAAIFNVLSWCYACKVSKWSPKRQVCIITCNTFQSQQHVIAASHAQEWCTIFKCMTFSFPRQSTVQDVHSVKS